MDVYLLKNSYSIMSKIIMILVNIKINYFDIDFGNLHLTNVL